MQEEDAKRSNPKKLRLIPHSEVRRIITATHDAINKGAKRTILADTILKLSHAYIDLSGAYKDLKRELSANKHTHDSRKDLLKDLIGQLEGQVQNSAEAIVEYEDEINALKKHNAGLVRRIQELEASNSSLSKKLDIKRQVEAVTGTQLKLVHEEDYDRSKDLELTKKLYDEEEKEKPNKMPRVKHSSQVWKPAKPNREEERRAAAMRDKVRAAGDETTEDILRLIGE